MATQPDPPPSARQQRRNAQTLSELLQRDAHRLRRQARKHAEFPADVDDVLQTAFLRFLERYRGVGEPLAWLYTTVKREAWAVSRHRSRRRERSATFANDNGEQFDLYEGMATDTPGPRDRLERSESLQGQRERLAALKRDERRALWLLGLGLSYVEICDVTGWTYTKVNRCVSEGRATLRRGQESDIPHRS